MLLCLCKIKNFLPFSCKGSGEKLALGGAILQKERKVVDSKPAVTHQATNCLKPLSQLKELI